MSPSETSIDTAPAAAACCGPARPGRLSLLRQAQLVAGAMALLGFLLGTFVAPGFHVLSGVVGLGLLHAGLRGRCGMAALLGRLPWNRGAPEV
jgi:hypothetical protein